MSVLDRFWSQPRGRGIQGCNQSRQQPDRDTGPATMSWRRIAGVAGLLGLHQYDTHWCHARFNRNVRTAWAAVATIYDYKVRLSADPMKLQALHDQVAERWYNTCVQNGGLYIKLGQSISTMNHVLPQVYCRCYHCRFTLHQVVVERFSQLHDQAPTIPYAEVCKIFQAEFGQDPHEVICRDYVPIL